MSLSSAQRPRLTSWGTSGSGLGSLAYLAGAALVLGGLGAVVGPASVVISTSAAAEAFLAGEAGAFFEGEALAERFSGVGYGLKKAVRAF